MLKPRVQAQTAGAAPGSRRRRSERCQEPAAVPGAQLLTHPPCVNARAGARNLPKNLSTGQEKRGAAGVTPARRVTKECEEQSRASDGK